ncbi:hypothetical protein HZB00_04280 [Candidatus Woesearchaeota archaeon]|nr:hypothetical protein [Candidatus Woesearchaeota archaeon]
MKAFVRIGLLFLVVSTLFLLGCGRQQPASQNVTPAVTPSLDQEVQSLDVSSPANGQLNTLDADLSNLQTDLNA